MASIINLQHLPQLVMETIISFLNHKQLLVLEQVSQTLKGAVDAYFNTTDHIIIGSLPDVPSDRYRHDEENARYNKCKDGLLKTIKRCGIRLKTIQITFSNYSLVLQNYSTYMIYFEDLFASDGLSNKCPNIENVIVSPNIYLDIIQVHDPNVLFQQNVLLYERDVEMYANNIKLSNKTCKLRSLRVEYHIEELEQSYQRILNLYCNLEQMSVFNPDETFFKYLHQFMQNGLKDLDIRDINRVNLQIAKKYCNVWKDLRVLRLVVDVESNEDIEFLNNLQLPKTTQFRIYFHKDCSAALNENICDSVIDSVLFGSPFHSSDRILSKFKNLQTFEITKSETLRVIVKSGLNKLRRIKSSSIGCERCYNIDSITDMCDWQELPQLLINNCKQLTYIDLTFICYKSMHAVWKALTHCKAAEIIHIYKMHVSPLTITYEDVEAICHLPNLHELSFSIPNKKGEDTGILLREQIYRAVKDHTNLQLKYTFRDDFQDGDHFYSLNRINY